MPELPDITIYIESLNSRIIGQTLQKIRIVSPFLVRSFDPPIAEAEHKRVIGLRRIGKQIVWDLEGELFLIFHLMIAGRFHWKNVNTKVNRKFGLAAFDFADGTLMLTEASTKKRASLHFVRGKPLLAK